jgi:hypothetical protein
VTRLDVPEERDLPPGRLTQLKEDLMVQIAQDRAPEASPHPRRRLTLVAAAVAAGLALATPLVLGGGDDASANTAVRNTDGDIEITIREAKEPKELERRLRALGVPAVVDFLESGFGCDHGRSNGWVTDIQGRAPVLDHAPGDEPGYVLHPDSLRPGETVTIEFQIDEHGEELAVNAGTRLTTGEVGPCEPVPNGSIVDADQGIAGG